MLNAQDGRLGDDDYVDMDTTGLEHLGPDQPFFGDVNDLLPALLQAPTEHRAATAAEAYQLSATSCLSGVGFHMCAGSPSYAPSVVVPGNIYTPNVLKRLRIAVKTHGSDVDAAAPSTPRTAPRFVLRRDDTGHLRPAWRVVAVPPAPHLEHHEFIGGDIPYERLADPPSIADAAELFTLDEEDQLRVFVLLADRLLLKVTGRFFGGRVTPQDHNSPVLRSLTMSNDDLV